MKKMKQEQNMRRNSKDYFQNYRKKINSGIKRSAIIINYQGIVRLYQQVDNPNLSYGIYNFDVQMQAQRY